MLTDRVRMPLVRMNPSHRAILANELIDALPAELEQPTWILTGHLEQGRFIEQRIGVNVDRLKRSLRFLQSLD